MAAGGRADVLREGDGHDVREGDLPLLVALRWLQPTPLGLVTDQHPAAEKADVLGYEAEHLTLPEAESSADDRDGPPLGRVRGDHVLELLHRPGDHALAGGRRRRDRPRRARILGDQPVLGSGAQDRVQDREGRPARPRSELGLEPLQPRLHRRGLDLADLHLLEARADVILVPGGHRGPHRLVEGLGREPLLREVAKTRLPSGRVDVAPGVHVVQHLDVELPGSLIPPCDRGRTAGGGSCRPGRATAPRSVRRAVC